MIERQRSRLFFAFEISEEVRTEANRIQKAMQGRLALSDARWADPADMHITVLFLGHHPNERLPSFINIASDVASAVKPFAVGVKGVGQFPTGGPARVLWMGAWEPHNHPASQIIGRLRRQLPDIPTDHPSYRPHITLAYVQRTADRDKMSDALTAARSNKEMSMIVDRLVLMQTIPPQERRKSNSARYNTVQVFPFSV